MNLDLPLSMVLGLHRHDNPFIGMFDVVHTIAKRLSRLGNKSVA
jgi:hypothetical protein